LTLGPQRLLGFAFASADLLLEIRPDGKISFAVGASEALSGSPETALVGRAWRDFIDIRDCLMVEALLAGLKDGGRGGPVVITLAGGTEEAERAASMTAFRMPGNGGAISCAFSRAAAKAMHGLHDKASFETVTASLVETAKTTGLELELALVEMGGLAGVRKLLGPEAAKGLEQRLAGALRSQSHGGAAAADLGADRYALVRQKGEGVETLVQRLVALVAPDPRHGVTAAGRTIAMRSDGPPGQVLRAIRYSLDSFIKDGMQGSTPASLNDAVSRSIQRTLVEVGALSDIVNGKRFRLVYQPVVDLKANAAVHHYEVLVRFGDNASPYPMIRMAEELDLIEHLDIAVVEQTVAKLLAAPKLKLAANISGRTIGSPAFVEAVRQMLVKTPSARNRLLFEITESAAIDDLAVADTHLKALRSEGCVICLDDFGAGAASLAYLQQLTLDIVKIDGRYIRELQHGGRESTFIRHLVHMCAELGVKTLAEMVENSQAEEAVRRAGVDYAQGWFYGAPAERPEATAEAVPALPPVKPAARRVGAVDSWG
jgi:EAL domain-containing protein (putative c-di-GMP-specific phosphodiesterase class I)